MYTYAFTCLYGVYFFRRGLGPNLGTKVEAENIEGEISWGITRKERDRLGTGTVDELRTTWSPMMMMMMMMMKVAL